MVQMSIQLQTFEANHILHIAVKSAQVLSIQLLLDKDTNKDVTDRKNSTTSHLSAEVGCIQVLEVLLEYSASVHVTDQDGNTTLLKTSKRNKKILDYRSKQKIEELC